MVEVEWYVRLVNSTHCQTFRYVLECGAAILARRAHERSSRRIVDITARVSCDYYNGVEALYSASGIS